MTAMWLLGKGIDLKREPKPTDMLFKSDAYGQKLSNATIFIGPLSDAGGNLSFSNFNILSKSLYVWTSTQ